MEQSIGMGSLEVAFDSLGTEFSLVEWKLEPGLEADDLVVLHLELDAALLTAETAVRLYQAIRLHAGVHGLRDGVSQMRTERLDELVGALR
jgi:hypothetical protein